MRNSRLYYVASTSPTTCVMSIKGRNIWFWMPAGGGYVREVTERRPGILGQQVSTTLCGSGEMMHLPAGADLTTAIRRAARSKAGRENLMMRVGLV